MIANRDELVGTSARETALSCVEAGVRATHPKTVIRDSLRLDGDALRVLDAEYDLSTYDEVVAVGGGNAAGHVAAALETLLGDRVARGVVVTDDPAATDRIEICEADHPVPSERGVAGARDVLDLAESADEKTLVLAVVTGGGSALMPAPAGDVTLADLQSTTDALLASGADIHEINAVRKHLSALKGGRLARAAAPATVVGLVLSDVVGNDLDAVASGPTAPDESTFSAARSVLDSYDLAAPERVRDRLRRGANGDIPETPRSGDPTFDRVSNHVLADGFTALDAAREVAADRGYETLILSSHVRGEAREAAKTHVAVAEESLATGNPVEPPAVVLSGGETTVTVRGGVFGSGETEGSSRERSERDGGVGGPNQEFAASAAVELDAPGVVLASIDTDGIDGPTDAAGAIVDAETVSDGDADAVRAALANNDVNSPLDERGALVRTGPTGTNVNDLRVLVVERES